MQRMGSILLLLLLLLYLVLCPSDALAASAVGIRLWFHTLLPALLPFIILSSLLLHTNVICQLFGFFPGLWEKVLGLTPYGAYAFLMGLFCGYPMGAKLTADLLRRGLITKNEGDYLLCISNNASPVFLSSYLLDQLLKAKQYVPLSFTMLYLAEVICSLLLRFLYGRFHLKTRPYSAVKKEVSAVPIPELLDTSIMNGFEAITRLGGYVLLFNLLASMLEKLLPSGPIHALTAAATELTSGAAIVAHLPWSFSLRYSILMAATAFGGFSCVLQTQCMIRNTALSIRAYLLAKLTNAALTFCLCRLILAIIHS